MGVTWDLSVLYTGFDAPEYSRDMERLGQMMERYGRRVEEIDRAGGGLDAAALAELLKQEEQMWVVGADLHKFTSMSQEANAADTKAADSMGRLKKLYSRVAGPVAMVRRWIAALALTDQDYQAYPILDSYRFYLSEAREEGRRMLGAETEEIMARMQSCAGGAWSDLRGYLTSFARGTLDGEELTLTQLRNLARADSADRRRAAYEAELACSKAIEGGVCFALNSIKEQTNLFAQLHGFSSVLEMTLKKSRMKRETLDAMWAAIGEYLPLFHAYLRRKAEMLGYTNGLPWYELFTGVGQYDRSFDTEEARAFLVRQLGSFAPDLGELVDRAFRENWIDFYPRPGKSGGAFCRNLSNQKQSRVLTNFNGTLDGVVTIAHELGHAYHGQQIQDHRPLNRTYSMPTAETASNFNETLVMNAAIAQAGGQEKLALLEQRIQDYTQTICDIYSRFLFERAVIEGRKEGFLFPERLCELMTQAQKAAYGDGLDPDWLHPYMWVNKVHYYFPDLSFYNFPYAFGALFAAGLYAQYQKEGAPFVSKYREMLRATTVCTVEDAAAIAGVDVTQKDFWRESLELMAAQIREFLSLTQDRAQ